MSSRHPVCLTLLSLLAAMSAACAGEGDGPLGQGESDYQLAGVPADPTFGTGGRLTSDAPIQTVDDGSIVRARVEGSDLVIDRLTNDGAPVTTFGANGSARVSLSRFGNVGPVVGDFEASYGARVCGAVRGSDGTVAITGYVQQTVTWQARPATFTGGFVVVTSADGAALSWMSHAFPAIGWATQSSVCGRPLVVGARVESVFMDARIAVPLDASLTPAALRAASTSRRVTAPYLGVPLADGRRVDVTDWGTDIVSLIPTSGAAGAPWPAMPNGSQVRRILRGADGNVRLEVWGGGPWRIETRTPDGVLVGAAIELPTASSFTTWEVDASGRIWVVVQEPAPAGGRPSWAISRFRADGQIDGAFGIGGTAKVAESAERFSGLRLPFLIVQGSAVLLAGSDAPSGPIVYRRVL